MWTHEDEYKLITNKKSLGLVSVIKELEERRMFQSSSEELIDEFLNKEKWFLFFIFFSYSPFLDQ
jgi:hypothetical protein